MLHLRPVSWVLALALVLASCGGAEVGRPAPPPRPDPSPPAPRAEEPAPDRPPVAPAADTILTWEPVPSPLELPALSARGLAALGDTLFLFVHPNVRDDRSPSFLHRSDDVGTTWHPVAGTFDGDCIASVNGALYVGCRTPMRSTDGEHFTRVALPRQRDAYDAWSFVPAGPRTIAYTSSTLMVSSDGRRWEPRPVPAPETRDLIATEARVIAYAGDESSGGLRESTDDMRTWSDRTIVGAPLDYLLEAGGRLVIGGTEGGLYVSSDGGASFQRPEHHFTWINGAGRLVHGAGRLWLSDWDVSVSTDDGRTWHASRSREGRSDIHALVLVRGHVVVIASGEGDGERTPRIERARVP